MKTKFFMYVGFLCAFFLAACDGDKPQAVPAPVASQTAEKIGNPTDVNPEHHQSYALLVGAQNYPSLKEDMWLHGPNHDVELMHGFLAHNRIRPFEEKNIRILADGIPGAVSPTHKAIVDALGKIAAEAVDGDFVYLHFSGHGSQQPAIEDKTEADGFDEIFLPVDIGKWDDGHQAVDHALDDNTLSRAILKIRQKGAFVWAVFDSCHSGTMASRGESLGEDVRTRMVQPEALGIPKSVMEAARKTHKSRGSVKESALGSDVSGLHARGGFVAFYAVQTNQSTKEKRLPVDADDRVSHGVFTYSLFEVLSRYPFITYRQASEQIMQRYTTSFIDYTPLFEGDLDARVFGTRKTGRMLQWMLDKTGDPGAQKLTLHAGKMHGLSAGTILAVVPEAASPDRDIAGYVKIIKAGLETSEVAPIAYKGKAAYVAKPKYEYGVYSAYARVVEQHLDLSLRVARPLSSGAEPDALKARVKHILSMLSARLKEDARVDMSVNPPKTAARTGLRLYWVDANDPTADIRLAYYVPEAESGDHAITDHLWLLPPSGQWIRNASGHVSLDDSHKTPSVRIPVSRPDSEIVSALRDQLIYVSRARNLLKLAGMSDPAHGGFDVHLKIRRTDGKVEAMPASAPIVNPGDYIFMEGKNHHAYPVDLNVLYIGSDYSIGQIWKKRIEANGELKQNPRFNKIIFGNDSFGMEHIVLIVSKGEKNMPAEDLGFLTQRAITGTKGMGSLLRDIAGGQENSRGAPLSGDVSLMQFTVDVQPAVPEHEGG